MAGLILRPSYARDTALSNRSLLKENNKQSRCSDSPRRHLKSCRRRSTVAVRTHPGSLSPCPSHGVGMGVSESSADALQTITVPPVIVVTGVQPICWRFVANIPRSLSLYQRTGAVLPITCHQVSEGYPRLR